MKIIALILSLLLLTSCSNPDTSGGVTLSRGGGDDANEFPYGSCYGQGRNLPGGESRCGWIHVNEESHYLEVYAILIDADLSDAYLRGADLSGVIANSRTTCPNGINWGTAANDCPF